YVRFLNPNATESQVRRATNVSMIGVGLIAVLANLDPPKYLQALVVISSSGGGASFTVPVLMACYWRRTTAAGMLAGMLVGFGCFFGVSPTRWPQKWALSSSDRSFAQTGLGVLGTHPTIGLAGTFCGWLRMVI